MGPKPLHIETAHHRGAPDRGTKKPIQGVADLCLKRLREAKGRGRAG